MCALTFGVCALVEAMEKSCTDRPCEWKTPRTVSNIPVPIRDLCISLDPDKKTAPFFSDFSSFMPMQPIEEDRIRSMVKELFSGSDSLILTTLTEPETLPGLARNVDSVTELHAVLHDKFTTDICKGIEHATREQSANPLWKMHRIGRITASMFKSAYTYKGDNMNNSVVKRVLNMYGSFTSPATQHGLDSEAKARSAYEESHATWHVGCNVVESGLHINPRMPHLGASPDGLIHCNTCGTGVLEIKAQYKKRDMTVQEACQDKLFVCDFDTANGLTLKQNSHWMYQVQGQLLITEASYCDFVLYTFKDTEATRIYPDEIFQSQMLDKLNDFYDKFIFPAMK